MRKILIVEDDPSLRLILEQVLRKKGNEVVTAADGVAAVEEMQKSVFDVILTDLFMQPMDGIKLLEAARRVGYDGPIVVLTACDDIGTALQTMRMGAFDFIVKPMHIPDLMETIERAFQYRDRLSNVSMSLADDLIAISPAMRRVVELGRRLAMTNAPILITGEPGTGKSLFARMIHMNSHRQERPFVTVDCERAAEADVLRALDGGGQSPENNVMPGGTLFLENVAWLTPAAQKRLLNALRVIGGVMREGRSGVAVRILATTPISLAARVEDGLFDPELFHRLSVLTLPIPPLRERAEDLAPLAVATLGRVAPDRDLVFNASALAAIECYAWPGNGIEMERALSAAVRVSPSGRIEREHLPPPICDITPAPEAVQRSAEALRGRSFAAFLKARERQALDTLLRRWNGDRGKVAEKLGISVGKLNVKLAQRAQSE